jgi:hypothetical protein
MNYFQCAKSHRIVTGLLLAVLAIRHRYMDRGSSAVGR